MTSRSCSSAGCSCTLQDGCSGCLISMDFSMLNFDFAMLISVQSGRPASSNDKSFHENKLCPTIHKHWQAALTKITELTGKRLETEKNCSQLTIGKSFSHPSDATISFEDLSPTTDPTSRWGSVIGPGGLLLSAVVLPPPPIWGHHL